MSFLLSVIALLSVAANAASPTSATWARNYAETVIMLNQINAAHVNGLKQCACYLQKKQMGQVSAKCQGIETSSEPEFIRQSLNFYGERISSKYSCETILEGMVFKKLENRWELLRLSMALMQPKVYILDHDDSMLTETFVNGLGQQPEPIPNIDAKITVAITHNIKDLPWKKHAIRAELPKLSQSEIKKAIKMYRDFGFSKCESLTTKMAPAILASLSDKGRSKYQGANSQMICKAIIDGKDSGDVTADFAPMIKKMREARGLEFRGLYKKAYAEMIQENPLLVMVSKPRPGWNELIGALDFIQDNARERLVESTKRLKSGADLSVFATQLHADMYASALWGAKGFSGEDYARLGAPVRERAAGIELRNSLIETGAVLGIIVGCALPWGKTIGIGLQLLKFACVVGVGVPLNAYFLLDSINTYEHELKMLMSTVEGDKALFDSMSKLSSDRDGMVASALLFPVGLQLTEAGQATQAFKHFFMLH